MASGFERMLLLKIPAKQGGTKRTVTSAQRNSLASSQGGEDPISDEDKHSQGDSNADKS